MAAAANSRHNGHSRNQPQQEALRQVDSKVWKACAGNSIQIPAVDSRVYYFPQGHIEHSTDPLPLSAFSASCPCVPCLVLDVLFLANRDTDEVFAKIFLKPIAAPGNSNGFIVQDSRSSLANGIFRQGNGEEEDGRQQDNEVVSFAKVLTPSDANNGGGFSVPKFCADSIFPQLDYNAEPPVQNITIWDVHGESWEFRHIYRGTPRRHLLTTGWSKFVNSKKLIAGDSVVFMRKKINGQLAVGLRRAVRTNAAAEFAARWAPHCASLGQGKTKVDEVVRIGEREGGFSRGGKGKVSPEAVADAANRAANGLTFEVVYYPKAGSPDFVVAAEKVDMALNSVRWSVGMRVKMAMETEDSSRMTWFQGTVSALLTPDSGLWRGSPWRALQVAWDEPEVLQNIKKVSPWEVEYVTPTPLIPAFPPAKKSRVTPSRMFLTEGEAEFSLPVIGFGNSMFGQFSSSHLNYNTFPAGMQGARQDTLYVSSLSNLINDSTRQVCAVDNSYHTMAQKEDDVSTDLNIGTSLSESPRDSACSVELIISQLRAPTSSGKTLQLFGQMIHVEVPVANTEDVSHTPTQSDDSELLNDTEGRRNMPEFSLSDPYNKLLDGRNFRCQTAPVVEA
ncbi:hypothetical protein Dimus_006798 [Dionaea muscipula]